MSIEWKFPVALGLSSWVSLASAQAGLLLSGSSALETEAAASMANTTQPVANPAATAFSGGVFQSNQQGRMYQPTQLPAPVTRPMPPVAEREVDETIFGAKLFRGHFARQSLLGFNPDYTVSAGDLIDLQLWGAFDLILRLAVDSQGNIFVPKVGPVKVLGIRNAELNQVVQQKIQQTFRENVGVYATLASAEPVKVFVTGQINNPGLYGAYASDSILHFLDRAGGINTDSGSFLDIEIRRAGHTRANVNLYDFLTKGDLPLYQFQDGDTIIVGARKSVARVTGAVRNAQRFEFRDNISLADLLKLASVDAEATHVRVFRHQTRLREADYISLDADLASISIVSGDEVSVFSDKRIGSIVTQVDGEFEGVSQYVLPYQATLDQLLQKVAVTPLSNLDGLQIYRKSLAQRQKEVLEEMLQKLEQAVLTARSGTREEAQLRTQEASLILQFVERARKIEPTGRLVLHEGFDPASVGLQDRDVLKIPRKTNTVAVQGEVFFPSSFVWLPDQPVSYYLEQAGGLTQNGDLHRIFLIRPSGEMLEVNDGWFRKQKVRAGDEVMVLPQVDTKTFQFSKDLIQIIYQLALSAGVVLSI